MSYKPNKAQRDWASGGVEGHAYGKDRLPLGIDLNTQAWSEEAAARHRVIGKVAASLNFRSNSIRATRIC